MFFRRPRIVQQYPAVAASFVSQTQVVDFRLGDGSLGANYVIIPSPNYNVTCLIEQAINGDSQIFIGLNVVNMGGMADITGVIEFQDPDDPVFWYPSHEPACSGLAGVETPLRTDAIALQEWAITAAGNFLIATRVEHPHFKRFRVRFRGAAGAPGPATDVRCYWYHNGGEALVPEQ